MTALAPTSPAIDVIAFKQRRLKMLTIHGVPISVHTRKVLVTAIEKNLPYRNEPVIPFTPPAGWNDLSPARKIPVITDGDFILRDSAAICAYLERMHPSPALYPADARAYAEALWFEEYAGGTVFREVIHGLFVQKIIRPKILKQETDTSVIETILTNALPQVFGYLENSITGDFIAGRQFTIADLAIVSNLINFHYLGYALNDRYPKLRSYFAAHIERPSIRTALVAEKAVAASMGLDGSFLRTTAAAAA
jgi:glutathione S-transferase